MPRSPFAATALVGAALLVGRPANAAEAGPVVSLTVASSIPSCPTSEAFAARVQQLLGESVVPADVTVVAQIRRVGDELVAFLEVSASGRPVGRRELHAPPHACADLAGATALAASLILEERLQEAPREASPDADASKTSADAKLAETGPIDAGPAVRSPSTMPRPASKASAEAEPPIRASTWAGSELSWRSLPHVGVGVVAGFSIRAGAVGGFVEGASFFPSEVESPLGAVLRVTLQSLRVGPCVHHAPSPRLVWIGCASAGIGSMQGGGSSRTSNPRQHRFVVADVGLRFGASVRIAGPFAARLEGRGAVPLTSAEFVLGGLYFRTPSWSLSAAALLETHF